MPFVIPPLSDIRDFIVALGKALFPASNYGSRRSWHGRKATYLAGAVTQLHAHGDQVQKDVHPLTAGEGKPINDWGATVGVTIKPATPSRKSAAGRVRGSAGSTEATLGAQLKHEASGLMFKLNQNVTIPGVLGVDPDSFVDADIEAVDVGSQTRLEAGETLSFVSTLTTIERNVILQLPLDEDGFDIEPFGSYRARVLATFSQTASGGNQSDFVKWTLESLAAISSAYVYPNRRGRGSVDIAAFFSGSGTARSLSSDERAAVALYIRTLTTAPFHITGTGGELRILETIADPRAVEILLTTNGQAAFAFDWDDAVVPTVLAWNGATREMQLSGGALPISMRAGHRIVLRGVASAQTGAELKIESISGVDKVIIEQKSVPSVAPAATDQVYSGGPLTTPVRDAIKAHLDGQVVYAGRGLTPLAASAVTSTVGLDILAEGIGSANPGGIYNSPNGPSWSGGIVRAALFGIAKYKNGVRDVTIVTPAANYEAVDDAFPNDAQIHYITPAAVLIPEGMMAAGGDKTISISPPGTIGFARSDAAVLLRFDETAVTDRPADAIGNLGDMVPGTVATAGVPMTMPAMVDGVTGRARQFTDGSGVALNGLVGNDIVSGTSLFTRDLTIQAILSLDVAAQSSSSGTGTVIRRGAAYALNLHVVSAPSRLCSMGIAVQFTMPVGFTMLTWTRRWESPTRTVSRYYVGDLLVGEEVGALSISGATIDPVFVGFGQAGGFDPFVGIIDELIVYGRELTAEEIENTWLRITRYQPRGVALFREMHDQGFPQSLAPDSDVQLENRMVGTALGFAAATFENIRANALPGRSYGSTLTDWETVTRVTPEPADSIDERRARAVARMRQRRGVSLGGLEDALVGLLGGAANSDLEFLAFSNTIVEDFTAISMLRWDLVPGPLGGTVANFAGTATLNVGALGTHEMTGAVRRWTTIRQAIGGDGKQAQAISLVAFGGTVNAYEAGIYFSNESNSGDFLLLGLLNDASTYRVTTESFIGGVSQGRVVQATLGSPPSVIWLHLYQTTVNGIWKAAWSTTSGTSGFTTSGNISHPTTAHWVGAYVRGDAGAAAASVNCDFDDFITRAPYGTRPMNAYVLLDDALGFDPDVDGATSVIQALKHAYTHACFITSRDLLCDEPFGCDCGPMGGI